MEHPLESLLNNIRGTEVILEACADFGTKVLVASTSEIYGKNAQGPLHEDADRILGSPFVARWSYSTSKAVDEILAHAYWRERDTPSIVVRLFNTVGPRQTGAYGMVVPRFVGQALRGEPLTVYGTGAQRRCFCHVHDTVAALMALLDHPDAVGSVFNIGAPNETTMEDLARSVIEMTGSDVVDRPRPLRRRLRGGVRGHGAQGARHLEDREPHRLAADAVPRGHPRRRDRLRAQRQLAGRTPA